MNENLYKIIYFKLSSVVVIFLFKHIHSEKFHQALRPFEEIKYQGFLVDKNSKN